MDWTDSEIECRLSSKLIPWKSKLPPLRGVDVCGCRSPVISNEFEDFSPALQAPAPSALSSWVLRIATVLLSEIYNIHRGGYKHNFS